MSIQNQPHPVLSPTGPCRPLKAPSWDKAGANVGTLSPASHGNSSIGHHHDHHHLTPAAAGDNRTAPVLLSQDPPGSCPQRKAHPPSALTWPPWPGLDSHARRLPLDSRCFRVCAERRGGAPVRAAPSVPASRPPPPAPRGSFPPPSSAANPQPLGKAHPIRCAGKTLAPEVKQQAELPAARDFEDLRFLRGRRAPG